ncbi:MAG: protein kinase [Coleofasciculaceae cyanobacterium]
MTPTLLNNRYRVIQTLGQGGFGHTFLAEDSYMPSGRRCVIKQLKPVTHDPEVYKRIQERFQREAAVLEDLGEGNYQIPRLFAYFTEAGQFYLVQEWIEGDTLVQKMEKRRQLPENEVKEILVSLLPVLDYVHSRRIVHRDIKPDNIIIRERDKLPVLIDFGAVKEAMSTVLNSQGNSTQSVVIGTPGFMPSEQAAGRPTYASDLYGLGMTAIFLLTGKWPRELETDGSSSEILWRKEAPELHSNLAGVIDRAIRFHPRERFANAREMLSALQSDTSVSEMDTVAVSPGRLPQVGQGATPSSDPTVPIARNPPTPVRGQQPAINSPKPKDKRVLIGGGLLVAAILLVFGLSRFNQDSSPVSPATDSASEQTNSTEQASSSDTSDLPTESGEDTEAPVTPTPDSEPSEPVQSSSDSATSRTTQREQERSSSDSATSRTTEQEQERSNSDSATSRTTEQEQERSNSDSAAPVTAPERTSTSESSQVPSTPSENNNRGSTVTEKIPGFSPGTQRKSVEFALGQPTKESRGLWNTRALLYEDYIPNQVGLGYLFDPNSGRLRQTDATFAQSVDAETIFQTLDQMLNSNASNDIKRGLEDVYQGQSDRYKFSSGRGNSLQGVIERNKYGRLYIAVWEADLKN